MKSIRCSDCGEYSRGYALRIYLTRVILQLVSAGASEGSLSAGNILKPPLARGDLQLIGATTLEEYRQHVEEDPAFARRFQVGSGNQSRVPCKLAAIDE